MNYTRLMILSGLLMSAVHGMPVYADTNATFKETATIDAPLAIVWQALKTERTNDPLHRQIISSGGGDYVVKEQFDHLPMVGEAICTYKEHETPMKKLDYHMLSSNKFKSFEGCWNLLPTPDGAQTVVTLTSSTDCGLNLPFSKKVTLATTQRSVEKKMAEVKELASSIKVAALPHSI